MFWNDKVNKFHYGHSNHLNLEWKKATSSVSKAPGSNGIFVLQTDRARSRWFEALLLLSDLLSTGIITCCPLPLLCAVCGLHAAPQPHTARATPSRAENSKRKIRSLQSKIIASTRRRATRRSIEYIWHGWARQMTRDRWVQKRELDSTLTSIWPLTASDSIHTRRCRMNESTNNRQLSHLRVLQTPIRTL